MYLLLLQQAVGLVDTGTPEDGRRYYSALCAVGNNENIFVREWVEHHKCLGE